MNRELRIASLAPAGTEMICFLGARKYLSGISHTCDYPSAALGLPRLTRTLLDDSLPSDAIDTEVNRRLRDDLPLYEIEHEVLQALAPTLVLAQSQCSVCAVDAQQAADLHLPGAEIFGLSANSLDEMLDECVRLAERLTSLGAEIDPLALAQLRARCERPQHAENALRPKVLVIEWISPLIVAGNWTPDLVERAGGASLLASPGEPSPVIEWAEVRKVDPEVLVIAPCGFDLARSLVEAESMRALPGWNELQAVKQDRVFVSNGNGMFHRCGPRLVETLEFLRAAICGDEAELARFEGEAVRLGQG
jgi:iron complex transport system substrate-binding protein